MRSQSVFLLVLGFIALAQYAAFADAKKVEVDDYPPNIFSYNATRCQECKSSCHLQFNPLFQATANPTPGLGPAPIINASNPLSSETLAQLETKTKECVQKCRNHEFCRHYVPAEMKIPPPPPPPLPNCTALLLPPIPPQEYVTADVKSEEPSPREYIDKLRAYMKWKADQAVPPAEVKPELMPDAPPVVPLTPACAECAHQRLAPPASDSPDYGDMSHLPRKEIRRILRELAKSQGTAPTTTTPTTTPTTAATTATTEAAKAAATLPPGVAPTPTTSSSTAAGAK